MKKRDPAFEVSGIHQVVGGGKGRFGTKNR
jgi:hypothetical protein